MLSPLPSGLRRSPSTPDGERPVECVLVVSMGGPFADAVVDRAIELARPTGARVSVLHMLRIWGTGLGLPHPSLRPNPQEVRAGAEAVAAAEARVRAAGLPISGAKQLTTRKPAKIIAHEARWIGADVIVLPRPQGRASRLGWDGEALRLPRKAHCPVVLVDVPAAG